MGMPQQAGGMHLPGFEYYTVLGFGAVSQVFTRKADFGSGFYHDIGVRQSLGESILTMDGPRHRRYRNLIQEHFQPAASEGWWREKVIAPLVEQLIARFEKADRVELNSQFCARLPMLAVTEAFGLPHGEGMEFRRCTQLALSPTTPWRRRPRPRRPRTRSWPRWSGSGRPSPGRT